MTRIKSLAMSGPGSSYITAVVIFVAGMIGHVGLGFSAAMAGVMVIYGTILLVFRSNATIEMLSSPGRDERTFEVNLKSAAIAYYAVIAFAIAAFLLDLAHGRTGMTPWVAVCVIGGLSQLASLVFFAARR